jgi:hypothetical protein
MPGEVSLPSRTEAGAALMPRSMGGERRGVDGEHHAGEGVGRCLKRTVTGARL